MQNSIDMKILYITTVGSTMSFFKQFIKGMVDKRHSIELACNILESPVDEYFHSLGCKVYPLSCVRSPYRLCNLKAIGEIRDLVKENHYDIVHCHTPVAAACTRLACHDLRNKGLKVIYTAHGFHFYSGAPFKNWLMYYPVEWLLSWVTDVLIAINHEDYKRAKFHLHAQYTEYVPGVGVDIKKFSDGWSSRDEKRRKMGIPLNAKLLLSVGELNENKNHSIVLKALAKMDDTNIYYAIAGRGSLADKLHAMAEMLGIGMQVKLLGYRKDVLELYHAADVLVHPSLREGLPVSIMEAMASGLPVICSDIRGCKDLVRRENRFDPNSVDGVIEKIVTVLRGNADNIVKDNYQRLQKFEISYINSLLMMLYEKCSDAPEKRATGRLGSQE